MPFNAFKINKILLHDNDEDEAYFFQQALKFFPEPIEVICSINFSELVASLEQAPDLIFLDINIPGMNGFECLKTIRSKTFLNRTPIIMYSNSKRVKEVQEAYFNGANLFVSKPTRIQNVVDSLKTVFSMDWNDLDGLTQKHVLENTILQFDK